MKWNHFFFEPKPVTGIAVYRILFGALLIANGILMAPEWLTWFGENGVLSGQTSELLASGPRVDIFRLLPEGDAWVWALLGAYFLVTISVTIGWHTRFFSVLLWMILVSLHHRNMVILNSGDTLLRVMSFFLIFSPAGQALSLDALRMAGKNQAKPAMAVPWAQRLMQIQVAVVYFSTFLWKLRGDSWMDGTALYYASRLMEFWRFPVPYFFEHLWTLKILTWAALCVEGAFPLLVWFKKTRIPILIAGVMLHLGIEYAMNIPLFALVMISTYVLFLDERDWEVIRKARI